MNLAEIVSEYLEKNKYDGLYLPGECACSRRDLFPCGEPFPKCEPGDEPKSENSEDDYIIGPRV